MSIDCLFCKIIAGEIKSDIIHEDEDVLAFRDINPQAPLHILCIPKKHIARISEIRGPEEQLLMGKLIACANSIADQEGVTERGFRLVFNCNEDANQTVFHIHLHLLAGRRFTWPPG